MTDPLDLEVTLGEALDQMEAVIAGIGGAQMGLPTPCADWDVRALLEHVVGGTGRFAAMAAGERVDWSAPQQVVLGDEPAAAYREGRALLEAARHEHPEVAARTLPMLVIEATVHAWDLAAATGSAASLDPSLAEIALGLARRNLTSEVRARTTAFGTDRGVATDAPAYARLAAFLGREP